jgi:hypothetical protein
VAGSDGSSAQQHSECHCCLCVLFQVRDLLKVEWVEGDPARGVEYVYLADEDYQRVHASVKAAPRTAPDGGCGLGQLGLDLPLWELWEQTGSLPHVEGVLQPLHGFDGCVGRVRNACRRAPLGGD